MVVRSKEEAIEVLEEEGIFPDPNEVSFEEYGLQRYIIFQKAICAKEEFSWELLSRARKALKAKWTYFNADKTIKIELPPKSRESLESLLKRAEERATVKKEVKEDICATCANLGHLKTTCELSGTYLVGRIHGKCSAYEKKEG